MIKPVRAVVSALTLGSDARIEIWHLIGDLMEANVDMGSALEVAVRVSRDQGQGMRAWVLERWRKALVVGRFTEEVARWVPATEAMVLQAEGRVDAQRLFDAAARIAEARAKQMSGLWAALGMPIALAGGILVSLWLGGAEFVPVMAEMAPREGWDIWTEIFADSSIWVFENDLELVGGIVSVGLGMSAITVSWSGLGRAAADRFPPFSLYRTIAGAAFLFVVIEFLRAGVDLNERTFMQLKGAASRYTRSRILAIEQRMRAGSGLGTAMVDAGQQFPDPSLVAVIAALEEMEGWEVKLAEFVNRWVQRSEELMKRRAAVLNGVLITMATATMAIAIVGMFGMMDAVSGSAL